MQSRKEQLDRAQELMRELSSLLRNLEDAFSLDAIDQQTRDDERYEAGYRAGVEAESRRLHHLTERE